MTLVCGYDIETTGLCEPEHRIIEVYAHIWDLEKGVPAAKPLYTRINPQRNIDPAAQRVHGISLMDVASCKTWEEVASPIRRYLEAAHYGVAHNGKEFDLRFLNMEFKRVGLPELTRPVIDTMEQARWATAVGKLPSLGELAFACDVAYDPLQAHKADYDVGIMMECFMRAYRWGWFKLPNKEAA